MRTLKKKLHLGSQIMDGYPDTYPLHSSSLDMTHDGPGVCARVRQTRWSIFTERCEAEVIPPGIVHLPPFPPSRSVPSSTPVPLSIPSIAVETTHIRDLDVADAGTATLRAAGVTISGHPSGLSACFAENVYLSKPIGP